MGPSEVKKKIWTKVYITNVFLAALFLNSSKAPILQHPAAVLIWWAAFAHVALWVNRLSVALWRGHMPMRRCYHAHWYDSRKQTCLVYDWITAKEACISTVLLSWHTHCWEAENRPTCSAVLEVTQIPTMQNCPSPSSETHICHSPLNLPTNCVK